MFRMESVFRMLLHEKKLLQGDPSDTKLLSSVQYQRRDLVTALETTRWQVRQFEHLGYELLCIIFDYMEFVWIFFLQLVGGL